MVLGCSYIQAVSTSFYINIGFSVIVYTVRPIIDCYGEDYRGNTSTTKTGFSCKNWTSIPLASYPDADGLGDHNFCRNPWPEDYDRPWCYVSDDNELEYCDVGDAQTSCYGRFLNRSTMYWKYYNYYFYKLLPFPQFV